MAQPGQTSTGEALPGYNYVAQDQIWKDHVQLEVGAAKKWPENWQFLTTKYEDLVKEDFPDRKNREKVLPPTPMRIPPVTPLEERVTVKASSGFPRTTANQIGFRSANPEYKLDKYGPYAKPKGGLINQFNWPAEGID